MAGRGAIRRRARRSTRRSPPASRCPRSARSGWRRSPTSTSTSGDPLRAAWHEVAELLIDHDEWVGRWRHHHSLMAAREIGTRPGTGGSPGVEYLRTTVDRRFFPDLWDVRLEL